MAAAYRLARDQRHSVVLVEASPRLGGKVASVEVAGVEVDAGPDGFLARGHAAAELCKEIGLSLCSPRVRSAYVWSRGKLRRLPDGLVFGVPGRLLPLLRSGIVPPSGVVRAALDLVMPATRHPRDFSVEDAVTSRLGRKVTECLVEPLIGGVHAAGAHELSMPEVAPHLAAAFSSSRSALLAIRRLPRPTNSEAPVFLSPVGGMHLLADRLASLLAASQTGVSRLEVITGDGVVSLGRDRHGRAAATAGTGAAESKPSSMWTIGPSSGRSVTSMWTLSLSSGRSVEADAVVLALPAFEAARLVPDLSPELSAIGYTAVCVVTLAYPKGSLPDSLDGSGFLSPRREGNIMTAATWLSAKWQHYSRAHVDLVRISAGRSGDRRAEQLDDKELVDHLHAELTAAMATIGLSMPPPVEAKVVRWKAALPLYGVGHRARITAIRGHLADLPGLHLAGAYLDGVGVPACVESGFLAARALQEEREEREEQEEQAEQEEQEKQEEREEREERR